MPAVALGIPEDTEAFGSGRARNINGFSDSLVPAEVALRGAAQQRSSHSQSIATHAAWARKPVWPILCNAPVRH